MIKLVIVLALMGIIYALASAVFFMLRTKSAPTSMVKALTWRISLSLLLFGFLFFAFAMGWIAPHAVTGIVQA
jgi:hypothetical protein